MLLQLFNSLLGALTSQLMVYLAATVTYMAVISIMGIHMSGDGFRTRRQTANLVQVGLTRSNMKDQYDSKYALPEGMSSESLTRIKAIFIHPVKSCGPIEVGSAILTKTGFQNDRAFAFAVDSGPDRLQFISQRTKPQMSLIKTELWIPHSSSNKEDFLVQTGGCIALSFPDPDPSRMEQLQAVLDQRSTSASPRCTMVFPLLPTQELEMKAFAIHSRTAHGLDMSFVPSVENALPKLKKFLGYADGRTLTLFKCTRETLSRTDMNLAPLENIGSPSIHGYTDQQPVNINSLASVHALSALLPAANQPLNALRFRANLWMAGAAAYDEESWKRCRIVSRDRLPVTLSLVCRTSRCPMVSVNPDEGAFTSQPPPEGKKIGKLEPTTTLVEHRTVEDGNRAALGYIGMHAVPEDRDFGAAAQDGSDLLVCVGDEVQVMERGVHLWGSTGHDY